jgi:hypothetical protein
MIEPLGVEVNYMHSNQQKNELMGISAIEPLFSGSGGTVFCTASVPAHHGHTSTPSPAYHFMPTVRLAGDNSVLYC